MLFQNIFDVSHGYIYTDNILKLQFTSFLEKFDRNKLGFILENLEDIERLYREDARNQVALDKYFLKSRETKSYGSLKVEYKQADNGLYGRYQAVGSIGGQGMVREVRHTIFDDFYVDIDIDNAHPVITSWLCKNLDIKCVILDCYINHRQKHFEDLMKLNPDATREHCKKAFLKISYGCGDEAFKELFKKPSKMLLHFRKEIQNIQKQICEKLFKFYEINKSHRDKNNKKYNYEGSCLSHICQFVENQLLLHIFNFINSKLKDSEIKNCILCFDGMMEVVERH